METIGTTGIFDLLPLKTKGMLIGWPDPHSSMRHFVLLKYLQVLMFPLKNVPLMGIGALASLYTALLLSSPRVSRKSSSVLLGQLAQADGLLLLHWGLGALRPALGVPEKALEGLEHGLLASHRLASLLLLGCVSLEAVLVCRRPAETRSLRTVRCARLACAAVWAAVALEFVVLQVSEYEFALRSRGGLIRLLTLICTFITPFFKAVFFYVRLALWLANTWIFYTVFCTKPQKEKSCFH
uniref:G-protein coupled receptors family 1 profile domain-containing protein n=1 Tax=Astyanax mexicanus TaxID=7994 RepID=A0A3B1JIA7_ASTMX